MELTGCYTRKYYLFPYLMMVLCLILVIGWWYLILLGSLCLTFLFFFRSFFFYYLLNSKYSNGIRTHDHLVPKSSPNQLANYLTIPTIYLTFKHSTIHGLTACGFECCCYKLYYIMFFFFEIFMNIYNIPNINNITIKRKIVYISHKSIFFMLLT